jgi:hypothetical protein
MTLTQDIQSTSKRNPYGSKGEKVTLIAVHGDVLLVEGVKGRFPVRKEFTDYDKK